MSCGEKETTSEEPVETRYLKLFMSYEQIREQCRNDPQKYKAAVKVLTRRGMTELQAGRWLDTEGE